MRSIDAEWKTCPKCGCAFSRFDYGHVCPKCHRWVSRWLPALAFVLFMGVWFLFLTIMAFKVL